jgi:hypothetical protein
MSNLNISSLPNDIIVLIVSFLESAADVVHFVSVNSAMCQRRLRLRSPLLSFRNIAARATDSDIIRVCDMFDRIDAIELDDSSLTLDGMRRLAQLHGPSIERLSLEDCSSLFSSKHHSNLVTVGSNNNRFGWDPCRCSSLHFSYHNRKKIGYNCFQSCVH